MIGSARNEDRLTESKPTNTENVRHDAESNRYLNENLSVFNFTVNSDYNDSIYKRTEHAEDGEYATWDTIAVVTKIIIPSLCVLGLLGNILNLTVIMKRVSNSGNVIEIYFKRLISSH